MSNETNDRSQQATFEQGRLRALELAVATFFRMQQEIPSAILRDVIKKNAATWDETTLGMSVTDEYRAGMQFGVQALLNLLPREDL